MGIRDTLRAWCWPPRWILRFRILRHETIACEERSHEQAYRVYAPTMLEAAARARRSWMEHEARARQLRRQLEAMG